MFYTLCINRSTYYSLKPTAKRPLAGKWYHIVKGLMRLLVLRGHALKGDD